MSFAVGSLVKARGREWVVLPESEGELLVLRPLGGTEDEVSGIFLPLEKVEPASFDLPDPAQNGDFRSCRLLRDAVRLGFRSSAGPFRSFARIAVEPRAYQIVPLLMALKMETVRLLIADDVGIGKTVEAGLVARELLDRGEVTRLAVLCLPQIAEQWQAELRDKFHIDAELVLPSTASRLERNCRVGQSLFDIYPFVVVSTDFIKSDRRLDEFLRTCPELVIVDEAHTCARSGEGRGGRHQRHRLVAELAKRPERHLILVTATPHSGNENAFRSLLGLLKPEFGELPDDLSGPENERHRRTLAAHFVQRRRADIRSYLSDETPFPGRDEAEETYKLSEPYRKLFEKVLRYARETVADQTGGEHRQRVRWWSALALLRSIASSPAAAAATLRSRASTADTATVEEADAVGRRSVLDLPGDESVEDADVTPGSIEGMEDDESQPNRRRLLDLAREADALKGADDFKLQKAITLLKKVVQDGFRPIVFCRFIDTADYVAQALREKLPKEIEVTSITGTLPPAEREARVAELIQAPKHILVCTDCLSEGINLQEGFDAVVHYDLSWNPTRHEQREGRVDRYGQPSGTVRALTYYGVDNQIDGIVLDVLLRKHKMIRNSLGISVPVPVNSDQVVEAIFEGLLLRGATGVNSSQLSLQFDEFIARQSHDLHTEWEATTEREKRSRTLFAQATIQVAEVASELDAVRGAIGSSATVEAFLRESIRANGGTVSGSGALDADLSSCSQAVQDAVGGATRFRARFSLPVGKGEIYLSRTHPIVEGLATYTMDSALDPLGNGVARRCGVIRTDDVERRTTLLMLRLRFHIVSGSGADERQLLAEDLALVAFEGSPQSPLWLDAQRTESLLNAEPKGNIPPADAQAFLQRVIDDFDHLRPALDTTAQECADELLSSHRRVRAASKQRESTYRVEPQLPPDLLGLFVFLPAS
ncbi:MAG: DEAD/DEAH box helicase [Armatimonadetes bacterium]|nr:DEAD/DEAH box helicase [Armatimonadota bacterium]MDE2207398.1 DEAD/DEAH box helicase [Armatimonadota bacterium]